MDKTHPLTPEACRRAAHERLQQRDPETAEQFFRHLLELLPHDVEALGFLANRHYARGELASARDLSLRAIAREPERVDLLQLLGAIQLANGDFGDAADTLRRSLQLAPQAFVVRLQLGIALEQLGRAHDALVTWYTAIRTAQNQGRWMNDQTTAPAVRDLVKYAISYVNRERRRLFSEALEPLRSRYGASELTRVEQSLSIYLGEQPANIPDARQQPKFLYFAGVPSQPYYERSRFPWLDALEQATDDIRGELEQQLGAARDLEPFLGAPAGAATGEMLKSWGKEEAAWDAYFFYRHGKRYDDHCAACPITAGILDRLPLVRIRDHAPETLFSVLRPGTHILPHRGVTNTRLVTHLPLIVPDHCAINVGGQEHVWRPGECVTFDDTFLHEAWNRSGETRVVLILDSWNPDLSEAERAAVTDLVEAISDFNDATTPPAQA
jgi:aspartate beta-hydroxylase